MKIAKLKFVSMICLFLCVKGAFAHSVVVGTADSELEKINFMVAMDAAVKSSAFAGAVSERQVQIEAANFISSVPAYENGDIYYLTGNLKDEWTHNEWDRYYAIAKWLVKSRFRVIMNPLARAEDIREAVQNPNVSIIIWSSHGSETGQLFDTDGEILPSDVFVKGASSSLRQIIFSNCYGEQVVTRYELPKSVFIKHWTGITTSKELFEYLFSDEWNKDLESTNPY